MQLIRQSALSARDPGAYGNVDFTSTRLAWPVTLLGGCFVIVMAIFAVFGQYTRKQSVSGQLVPEQGVISVLAPTNGVLSQLLVGEGERVKANQPLAVISLDQRSEGLLQIGLQASLQQTVERQRLQYREDLDVLDQSARVRVQALKQQVDLLQERLQLNNAQRKLKQRQLEGVSELLARLQQMKVGALTAFQLQQHEGAVLSAQSELNQVALARLDIERELGDVQDQQRRLPLESASRRSTIEQSLAGLDQAQARNQIAGSQTLSAPRDGVVSSLFASAGQSLTSGSRVISLIPEASPLQAELWVPSEAIGTIGPGTQVALRYRAFPFRRFGHQHGEIISVSGNALPAAEVFAASGLSYDSAMYRVRVALQRQSVLASDGEYPIRSGMYVDADLLLESRALIQLGNHAVAADGRGNALATIEGAH